jgi:hypothetical protein
VRDGRERPLQIGTLQTHGIKKQTESDKPKAGVPLGPVEGLARLGKRSSSEQRLGQSEDAENTVGVHRARAGGISITWWYAEL